MQANDGNTKSIKRHAAFMSVERGNKENCRIGLVFFSGIAKVPAIEPIYCCGSQKYGFFVFLKFSLKWKNPGKFFSTQKKRLDKGNPTVQNSLPYVA
jgi:hypothetical protein